jgi:site-specific recombinase XerD
MIDPHAVEDILNGCNSPNTRRLYEHCIKEFKAWYETTERQELNTSTIMAYRAKLTQKDISSSLINSSLMVVKRLASYQNQDNPMMVWSIDRNIKGIPQRQIKPRKALTLDQVRALLLSCHNETVKGYRDEAILAGMFGAGLRRGEVVKLDLTDFDGMDLLIRQSKGRKSRSVPLPDWAIRRLNAWLGVRPHIDGEKGMFTVSNGRMTSGNLYAVFRKRTQAMGWRGLHPHNARTTYITHLLKLKNDIAIVARLVGHSDVQTTTIYDLRSEEELRLAVNSFLLD